MLQKIAEPADRNKLHTCATWSECHRVYGPSQATPIHVAQRMIATTQPSIHRQVNMATEPQPELSGL